VIFVLVLARKVKKLEIVQNQDEFLLENAK